MGYALYWHYHKPEPKGTVDLKSLRTAFSPEFISKVRDAIKVASQAGIELGDWEGCPLKEEAVTDTVIKFNGLKPESCETFTITAVAPQGYWDCCKTNYGKYTALCMEILQLAVEDGILENWSSDGGEGDVECREQWNKLYKRNSDGTKEQN